MLTRRFASTPKTQSLLACALVYVVALVCAWVAGVCVKHQHPLIVIAVADIAATLVVFLFSVVFDNSSMYDPYWSVAPVVIVAYYLIGTTGAVDVRQIVVGALICWWALRLTWNWVLRWRGLGDEDWRYADFRTSRAYWLVSFVGFHLFPTVAVFAGCLPLLSVMVTPARPLNAIDAAAAILTIVSIIIEMRADKDLRAFRNRTPKPSGLLTTGLWARCRHPNYLGEVAFWWGIALFGIAACPQQWWTTIGAVAMTLLFAGISIPMMDRHMSSRHPDYRERMKAVPALLPGWRGFR